MSIREKVELDSKKMRETGNLRFKEKKFEKALEAYSQAALGPGPTTDKALALANRSGNLLGPGGTSSHKTLALKG